MSSSDDAVSPSSGSRMNTAGAERNCAGWRDTSSTSSYPKTPQNPGPSGSTQNETGDSSRSRRKTSCGGPSAKTPGSHRSVEVTLDIETQNLREASERHE